MTIGLARVSAMRKHHTIRSDPYKQCPENSSRIWIDWAISFNVGRSRKTTFTVQSKHRQLDILSS